MPIYSIHRLRSRAAVNHCDHVGPACAACFIFATCPYIPATAPVAEHVGSSSIEIDCKETVCTRSQVVQSSKLNADAKK